MNKLLSVFLLFLLIGCSGKSDESTSFSNEIDLSLEIRKAKEKINLSDFVDSITFIPLATNPNNLFQKTSDVYLTTDYIFHDNDCFEWNGKFVSRIGRRGQGPCEEPGIYIGLVAYINEHFYTQGSKLIEYDKNGNCTGKEKSLFHAEEDITKTSGSFVNLSFFRKTGENLIAFNHPDSVFFFNTDFEVISSYPTSMEWGRPEPAQSPCKTSLTYYNDTVVFYHYYTDTVYHVTGNTLTPKWVIKIDESDKLSRDYVYKNNELQIEAFDFFQQGRLDEARICKDMDNKICVRELYETDRYLFMKCHKTAFFREVRNIPVQLPYLVFYDKTTGETTASQNYTDDICGLDYFRPNSGVCDNKMVMSIWPYKLEEIIREKQNSGLKVDERLLQLMQEVDIEDNPILVVAHLKK
jgi:hypothetical protein